MTLGGSTVDVPLSTSTILATRDELFSTNEQLALAGFLTGYSGLTRDSYTLDLRQYVAWCTEHRVAVFGARRADIECFARHLESLGRSRATIARRLCTVSCFYRYAQQEGLIAVSPAAHVRRPRLDYESHATGLDRNEVGAMLVAAGLATARDHALISVLALNGLRVSEAISADIEDLGLERGHRTLTIVRKGGKVVTVPLAPRTARAIDLAVGERCAGPIFATTNGERIDRNIAGRIVPRIARRAGIAKRVGPHTLRHALSPPPSTRAFHCATSKKPPVTPIPARPCAMTAPGCRSTGTPPTSWQPSSPLPAADPTAPPLTQRRFALERSRGRATYRRRPLMTAGAA
jgi:site-specific recombinase XerD